MKVEEGKAALPAARRHIIRRPRLTRMLDESGARIILLVAPAGYGKTILAKEWLSQGDRRAAWYRGGPASADVAALAVGLAKAAAEIALDAGDRMQNRLRVSERPHDDARILAEILSEELADWPNDAWLVFDDYHFALESPAAETFVDSLLQAAPIRVLVTSRRRPSWTSARRRLYGEAIELGRLDLAMTDVEAAEVLQATSGMGQRFLAQGKGWPAVIGLAGLAADTAAPVGDLPDALYDYFAEEVLQGLSVDAREALIRIGAIPEGLWDFRGFLSTRDHALVHKVAEDLGFVSPSSPSTPGGVELHPLFRDFLQRKFLEKDPKLVRRAVTQIGEALVKRFLWDELFTLARQFDRDDLFLTLMDRAVGPMLEVGRLSTVSSWIGHASDRGHLSSPRIDLAEAEISLREGQHDRAEVLSIHVLGRTDATANDQLQALLIAGRAAHLEGRSKDAADYYGRARPVARSASDRQAALWGEFLALVDLERPESDDAFTRLKEVSGRSADEVLRIATASLQMHVRYGAPLLREVRAAVHLLSRAKDPMVRSAFLNMYSSFLAFRGEYEKALELAKVQIEEAERLRLTFTMPYAHAREAAAHLGLRGFAAAHRAIDAIEAFDDGGSDSIVRPMAEILRASVLISSGRACDMTIRRETTDATALPSLDGELLATWSLGSAAAGDLPRALHLARLARARTRTNEAWALARLTRRVIEVERSSPGATARLQRDTVLTIEQGNINAFVLAYRAYPNLLEHLKEHADRVSLSSILTRANDGATARSLGLDLDASRGPRLSGRENEVLALLAEGKTNREIAHSLYLSESTVKVHVRHIFEKLDVRSRTAAARYARLED